MRFTATLLLLAAIGGCNSDRERASDAAPDGGQPDQVNAPSGRDTPDQLSEQLAFGTPPASLLPNGPTEADYPHLHNLMQVTGAIYTGGEPKEDEAFAELAELGIKTVVSVDGARPKIDAAEQHGMRYVHIPFGYDGIEEHSRLALARLVRDAEGPLYIHCHHGTHRGPAGAAIACVASGAVDGQGALAILEKAGTSKDYAGLWRDVAAFAPPSEGAELPELVSVAKVDSLASAMASVDRASDNLKLSQAADWQAPPNHPDIVASQEALLLKEGFHEALRLLKEQDAAHAEDQQYQAWMSEAESAAARLEIALARGDAEQATEQMLIVQRQCKSCHAQYRN